MKTNKNHTDLTLPSQPAQSPPSVATRRILAALGRADERGVTLIEVLIVIAIMALIAGGVGFMVIPKMEKARVDTARQQCQSIRSVTQQYIALQGGDCPTVETLIAEKELDGAGSSSKEDPWGGGYKIVCTTDGDVVVSSPGKDKQDGTEDDIVVGGGGDS